MKKNEKKDKVNGNVNEKERVDGKKAEKDCSNNQEDGLEQDGNNSEIENLKAEIESLNKKLGEANDLSLRLKAEFLNFKKRTEKEKQELYSSSKSDCVLAFLPVLDSLERAVEALTDDGGELEKGVKLIFDLFCSSLKKLGVSEIESEGEVFNPNCHNAINVVNDEKYGDNVVCKVFQKGYRIGDLVIRHAVVSVANP